jgi:hypothetical protein
MHRALWSLLAGAASLSLLLALASRLASAPRVFTLLGAIVVLLLALAVVVTLGLEAGRFGQSERTAATMDGGVTAFFSPHVNVAVGPRGDPVDIREWRLSTGKEGGSINLPSHVAIAGYGKSGVMIDLRLMAFRDPERKSGLFRTSTAIYPAPTLAPLLITVTVSSNLILSFIIDEHPDQEEGISRFSPALVPEGALPGQAWAGIAIVAFAIDGTRRNDMPHA